MLTFFGRFPENDLTQETFECPCCRPSLHLVFAHLLKVSGVIETISQPHFVSVSSCKTVPLRPSNDSSCPTQGCGPTPRRGAASMPRFDWLSSCHRARSLGVAFSQFSSYGVSLRLFMAQVRGRATELHRRHPEDEENDDGLSDSLVVVAEVFRFAPLVLAIPHQGETCGDRWSRLLAQQKRTGALRVTEPDCCVQHFVPAILDSRNPDFQTSWR